MVREGVTVDCHLTCGADRGTQVGDRGLPTVTSIGLSELTVCTGVEKAYADLSELKGCERRAGPGVGVGEGDDSPLGGDGGDEENGGDEEEEGSDGTGLFEGAERDAHDQGERAEMSGEVKT
jgi:hypothetical protein